MKRVGYFLIVLAVALAIGGCQNWSNIADPDNSAMRMNPAGTADVTIDSAYLWIYVVIPTGQMITAHEVTAAWNETTVTWNSFANAFSPDVEGSFIADDIGWRRADITSLVRDWMNGVVTNFGVLLEQTEATRTTYYSSEEISVTLRPKIEFYLTNNGQQQQVTVQRGTFGEVYDTFIWAAFPNDNFGLSGNLFTGMLNEGYNKTLIQFTLPVVEETGSVGDLVWCDDGDGIQEDGELGLGDITVKLKNCADSALVATEVTDSTGHYLFENVVPGDYFLSFDLPEGLSFAPKDQSDNDCHDSDVYPTAGITDCFTLDTAAVALCWDAGIICETPPPDSGCTRTIGYWKNHAGFGPQEDVVTPLLPIWLGTADEDESILVNSAQVAYDILTQHVYGEPSNGITKLYAQLLAAKLNIAAGASGGAVGEAIGDANEFLAAHSWESWASLTRDQKNMVLQWKDQFDMYNNGWIGPGHCDEDDDDSF